MCTRVKVAYPGKWNPANLEKKCDSARMVHTGVSKVDLGHVRQGSGGPQPLLSGLDLDSESHQLGDGSDSARMIVPGFD